MLVKQQMDNECVNEMKSENISKYKLSAKPNYLTLMESLIDAFVCDDSHDDML